MGLEGVSGVEAADSSQHTLRSGKKYSAEEGRVNSAAKNALGSSDQYSSRYKVCACRSFAAASAVVIVGLFATFAPQIMEVMSANNPFAENTPPGWFG